MVTFEHPTFSVRRQCQILGLDRSGLYYEALPESAENLLLMNLLDRRYTRHPEEGVRRMTLHLRDLGLSGQRQACAAAPAPDGTGSVLSQAPLEHS
jgi:hypothetical protein